MKEDIKLGISLYSFEAKERGETLESLDERWIKLLQKYHITPFLIPNHLVDVNSYCDYLDLDGFILSGGNDIFAGNDNYSAQRNACERTLLEYAAKHHLAVLGVCRGMQFMNVHCGGELENFGDVHIRSQHQLQYSPQATVQSLKVVNSFHRFGISSATLAQDFCAFAYTKDGCIEGFTHKKLPWLGIMWHPERPPFEQTHWKFLQRFFHLKKCIRTETAWLELLEHEQ